MERTFTVPYFDSEVVCMLSGIILGSSVETYLMKLSKNTLELTLASTCAQGEEMEEEE